MDELAPEETNALCRCMASGLKADQYSPTSAMTRLNTSFQRVMLPIGGKP
jgi:hypothetical protein